LSRASENLGYEWQQQITEKVNFLEKKIISMDNGLAGAGENIKKILEHLQRSGTGGTTPPRKKQSIRPPLSPLHENQRSAISEIARAQRPVPEHMSPRTLNPMCSRGVGEGFVGDDDETEGNENHVVDLGDEAPYMIPCTQKRREKSHNGKGKAVVVLDSQSGGDDDETQFMEEYELRRPQQQERPGEDDETQFMEEYEVRRPQQQEMPGEDDETQFMEEYEVRRPKQPEKQEERKRMTTCKAQGGRRRLDNGENGEENPRNAVTAIHNVSEEEDDDSDTRTQIARRRNAKQVGGLDASDATRATRHDGRPTNSGGRNTSQPQRSVGGNGSNPVPISTQGQRRPRNTDRPQSPKSGRAVGVAAAEVPQTLRPRKNGVSWTIASSLLFITSFWSHTWNEKHRYSLPQLSTLLVEWACAGTLAVQHTMLAATSRLPWEGCGVGKSRSVREI
jgi:hypothetical protein